MQNDELTEYIKKFYPEGTKFVIVDTVPAEEQESPFGPIREDMDNLPEQATCTGCGRLIPPEHPFAVGDPVELRLKSTGARVDVGVIESIGPYRLLCLRKSSGIHYNFRDIVDVVKLVPEVQP